MFFGPWETDASWTGLEMRPLLAGAGLISPEAPLKNFGFYRGKL